MLGKPDELIRTTPRQGADLTIREACPGRLARLGGLDEQLSRSLGQAPRTSAERGSGTTDSLSPFWPLVRHHEQVRPSCVSSNHGQSGSVCAPRPKRSWITQASKWTQSP